MENTARHAIAFEGSRRIAVGELTHVVLEAKKVVDRGSSDPVLVFDGSASTIIEVDFRGTAVEVLRRIAPEGGKRARDPGDDASESTEAPRGPGRPKLGVVAREVTLLPRHWAWLNSQPGGASVALRKLVENARRTNAVGDRVRQAQESAYRFMVVMAGNQQGFEEATRALFADKAEDFERAMTAWPPDVRDHANDLASVAFDAAAPGV